MITEFDAAYWNGRYSKNETGWDTGGITTPLKEYIDQLPDKDLKILLPGAGNAWEAEYLLENGFTRVFVCDFAAEAISRFRARVPHFPSEQLLHTDFFSPGMPGAFDLVIEQTFFCALDPVFRSAYFHKMQEVLRPGGRLTGLLFNDPLNSDRPPFGGSEAEYRRLIDANGQFSIRQLAPCYNSIAPRAGRELFFNLVRR